MNTINEVKFVLKRVFKKYLEVIVKNVFSLLSLTWNIIFYFVILL